MTQIKFLLNGFPIRGVWWALQRSRIAVIHKEVDSKTRPSVFRISQHVEAATVMTMHRMLHAMASFTLSPHVSPGPFEGRQKALAMRYTIGMFFGFESR